MFVLSFYPYGPELDRMVHTIPVAPTSSFHATLLLWRPATMLHFSCGDQLPCYTSLVATSSFHATLLLWRPAAMLHFCCGDQLPCYTSVVATSCHATLLLWRPATMLHFCCGDQLPCYTSLVATSSFHATRVAKRSTRHYKLALDGRRHWRPTALNWPRSVGPSTVISGHILHRGQGYNQSDSPGRWTLAHKRRTRSDHHQSKSVGEKKSGHKLKEKIVLYPLKTFDRHNHSTGAAG
ncbi:hypothetical protein RRG08_066235 [Elysia crispata]|uniref:Uncharacterized protein n=1 Tax=Elysia crispata TaxID=231223 RepID=A0AAE1EDU3_9GAST|nr:hypothetical protein RRG08_066235 [Elysia crispata]